MVTDLYPILARNQGNVLTAELAVGIAQAYDRAAHAPVFSSLPTREFAPPYYQGDCLVCDDRERVGEWVARKIGRLGRWGEFAAIGQEDKAGELVAGMVLEALTSNNSMVHFAIADGARLRREFIYSCMDYAFNQLDLERLTAHVSADNEAALRFDLHFGFEQEFLIPKGDVCDVHQLVLWRDRCRFLPPRNGR